MKSKLVLFIIILSMTGLRAHAQNQCAESLSQAEEKYKQGKLYDIPALLTECIDNGFSKEEEIKAYRLLTLSWLFLNYEKEADAEYLKLLRLSPEFVVDMEHDPNELINHAEKFTTKPIFYLNPFKLGFNFSSVTVLNQYSLSSTGDFTDKYSSQLGFNAGFGAEMVVYKDLHIAAEFLITGETFHHNETHWDFYTTDMDISSTKFEVPIMLKYNFFRGKVNPFASAGLSPVYLARSSIKNIQGNYKVATDTPGEFEEFLKEIPTINTAAFRNKFNYSLLLGAGINYKIGLDYLVFEARYSKGMMNLVNTENRWREDIPEGRDMKFPTAHVDDDFKVNNLTFFVGYMMPLYKPRKIK